MRIPFERPDAEAPGMLTRIIAVVRGKA